MASPWLAPDGPQVKVTQSGQAQAAQCHSGYLGRKMELGVPCHPPTAQRELTQLLAGRGEDVILTLQSLAYGPGGSLSLPLQTLISSYLTDVKDPQKLFCIYLVKSVPERGVTTRDVTDTPGSMPHLVDL